MILSLESFAASLHHSSLLGPIPVKDGGVLWVWAKSRAQNPPLGRHTKYRAYFTLISDYMYM